MLQEVLGRPIILLSKLNSRFITAPTYPSNIPSDPTVFSTSNPFYYDNKRAQWIIDLVKPGYYFIRNLDHSFLFLDGRDKDREAVFATMRLPYWDKHLLWRIILNGQRNEYSFVSQSSDCYISSQGSEPIVRSGDYRNVPQAIWKLHLGDMY